MGVQFVFLRDLIIEDSGRILRDVEEVCWDGCGDFVIYLWAV